MIDTLGIGYNNSNQENGENTDENRKIATIGDIDLYTMIELFIIYFTLINTFITHRY